MANPEKRRPGYPLRNSPEAKEYTAYLRANHKAIEKEYGLPDGLLFALSSHESGLDPLAISGSYAKGAFQFTKTTGRSFGLVINDEIDERLDYKKAIHAAAKYMSANIKRYGNVGYALADYNGGPKAVAHLKAGNHPKTYDSGNGYSGELDGFLSGIAQHGVKNGFLSIDKEIKSNVYDKLKEKKESPQNSEEIQIPVVEKKKDSEKVTKAIEGVTSFVGDQRKDSSTEYLSPKNHPELFNQFKRRQVLKTYSDKPFHIKIGGNKFYNPEPKNQVIQSDTKNTDRKSFLELAPDLFQAYKSGGKIVQLSGDGKTVEAILQGKERIYSRGDTKRLMELAKKAKTNNDFFLLGKFLYDATKKQDSRPPEYVDA